MEELTQREKNVLNLIIGFISINGYPPTIREIGKLSGLSSPASSKSIIDKLKNKGYISYIEKRNRTIIILKGVEE